MMKEESSDGGGGGGGGAANGWARVCDTCRSAACTVYCKADLAYLCAACDSRVHAANRVASRHERVYVCEACEQAPAAFFCKADAASLCAACDADIHSANPLARRHQRVPILPISGSVYGPGEDGFMGTEVGHENEEEDEEAASWLLINPTKNSNDNNNNNNNNFLFGGEVDEYLDLVDYNGENQYIDQYNHHHQQQQHHHHQQQFSAPQKNCMSDSIVPVQYEVKDHQNQQSFQLGLDYESSKAAYSFNNSSVSHSVSNISSSLSPLFNLLCHSYSSMLISLVAEKTEERKES